MAGQRRRLLQQVPLLVGRDEVGVAGGGLQPQQALVAPKQIVTLPDAAYAGLADLDAFQVQLIGDELGGLGGMGQAEAEDGLLDLGRDAVGMRPTRAAALFDWGGAPPFWKARLIS